MGPAQQTSLKQGICNVPMNVEHKDHYSVSTETPSTVSAEVCNWRPPWREPGHLNEQFILHLIIECAMWNLYKSKHLRSQSFLQHREWKTLLLQKQEAQLAFLPYQRNWDNLSVTHRVARGNWACRRRWECVKVLLWCSFLISKSVIRSWS